MEITGVIKKILFQNDSFAIVVLKTAAGDEKCTGPLVDPYEGMEITAEGEYTVHEKYGRQFKITDYTVKPSTSDDGVYHYLTSGVFRGVGKALATRIIAQFGAKDVINVIELEPERLAEVPGIAKKRIQTIVEDHEANADMLALNSMALTYHQREKLKEAYGKDAAKVIKETPYKAIYDISGFGFKVVDGIALKNGVSKTDPMRIGAAIVNVLTTIGDQGHCWTSVDALENSLQELIPEVSTDLIADRLVQEITDGHVINDDGKLYDARIFNYEDTTAKILAGLVREKPLVNIPAVRVSEAIADVEAASKFQLDDSQRDAVQSAIRNRVSVITGGPGTGKSTIIKAIVKAWLKQFPDSKVVAPEDYILMCAPTGKAARRMSEVTNVHAETIQKIIISAKRHRNDPEFRRKLIILDEASMVDIELACSLMELVKGCGDEGSPAANQLVMIGDIDQLPPIGPGNFFRDCVTSPAVPTVRLNLSHRQHGYIAINAKRINDGMGTNALTFAENFTMIEAEKEQAQDAVVKAFMDLMQTYSVKDVCCIVPMRKAGRSHTAADDLNARLRELINPENGKPTLSGCPFRVGDRVMNTSNDYTRNIFNGDCAVVQEIRPDENLLILEMDSGEKVECSLDQTKALTLAYAITVHKSQGSEYKAIVVAQNKEHYVMLQRNLLYTAVTRAKEQVIIVGEKAAINMAVRMVPSMDRNTCLKSRIKNYLIH